MKKINKKYIDKLPIGSILKAVSPEQDKFIYISVFIKKTPRTIMMIYSKGSKEKDYKKENYNVGFSYNNEKFNERNWYLLNKKDLMPIKKEVLVNEILKEAT